MKKKIIIAAIVAALCLTAVFALAACNNDKTDWKYIQDKGTITVGVTPNAPITITDDSGVKVLPEGEGGFDTDLAYAVAKELGLKVEFVVINWDSKVGELNSKAIDLVWNGMTRDSEREASMELSKNYLKNKQVAVAKKGTAAAGYQSVEALKEAALKVAVEGGGTGEKMFDSLFTQNGKKIKLDAQIDALMDMKMGKSDIAICDLTMAGNYVKNNTDCVILADADGETLGLAETEFYAIAARKGDTEFIKKINEVLVKLYKNGTYDTIAARYGLSALEVEIK